jgi:hypothetical protein
MEQIKLSNDILIRIKKEIDNNTNKDKKAVGFSQLTVWYATQHITKGQAQQIISFYNHYDNNDPKDRERKEIYDRLSILPFAKNSIAHLKRIEATKRKTHSYTQTNRTVDRLTKPSLAIVRPTPPPTTADIKVDGINETLERFKDILTYCDNVDEGLKMGMYRVTYTIGDTKHRITKDIAMYSNSETMAIEKIKKCNPSIKYKTVTILAIEKK